MKLSTLIGLDDHPGEVPGSGPVHAFLARTIVAQLTRGHWRHACCDDDGNLTHEGVIHARPSGATRGAPPVIGGIVEISVPETLLDRLRANPALAGPWAPVVADILRRRQERPKHGDPRRRVPSAALRRYVQVRDRVCAAPGCRAPAAGCDLDHRIDYARGGPTSATNLLPLCRHDHRLKHEGRWALTDLPGGGRRWRTPNGLTFSTRPPPLIEDLPPPHPRA